MTEDGMTVVLHPAIMVLVDVSIIALQLSRESYTLLFPSTVICSRDVQPPKNPFPIFVTKEGILIFVREEHP